MQAWIARDTDGRLYIHFEKPWVERCSVLSWKSFSYTEVTDTPLDEEYQSLEFEDGPRKIDIT